MRVELRDSQFNPWVELGRYQDLLTDKGRYGATAVFVGTMRDFNEGVHVISMFLEHYPGMTEKHLTEISEQAISRWDLLDTLVIHRVGEIQINEPIVLVAVWSAHRAPAFEACRFIVEDLKSRAPFWKREFLDEGIRWVEENTPG